MSDFGWVDGALSSVRCGHCKAVYDRSGLNIVGKEGDHWIFRCTCRACQTQSAWVVILKRFTLASPTATLVETAFVDAGTLCPKCRKSYFRSDFTATGHQGRYWFLFASCHDCSTKSVLVAVIYSPENLVDPSEPALAVNDVIAAHDALREYAGDVHGLFDKKRKL